MRPVRRSPPESDEISHSTAAAAIGWGDGGGRGSKVVIGYDHPHFRQYPAVVSNDHGQGRITTVGTVPNAKLAADLIGWLAPPSESQRWTDLPTSVTVTSATNADGERIHIVHNWSWQPVTLTAAPTADRRTRQRFPAGPGNRPRALGRPGACRLTRAHIDRGAHEGSHGS